MTTWKTDYWRRLTSDTRDLDPAFARHLRDIARPVQIAFTKLMRASNGNPVGFEVRTTERQAWKVVLPEPVAEGHPPAWRILRFDVSGFSGHTVHNSLQQAAEEMLMSGYTELDLGALDRCSTTQEWATGLKQQALRDRFARGEIDWRAMALESQSV